MVEESGQTSGPSSMATTSNTEELMARFMPARVERELRNRDTTISYLNNQRHRARDHRDMGRAVGI